MNGVIIINKPKGKTSHDCVGFIRRLTGIKKVGHTGTLDPIATGVLPICIGNATKACELLTGSDKEYLAEMILGKTTDTLDAQGNVLGEYAVNCTKEDIINAVAGFVGEIWQIPPMYSAIKKNGKKLYELAREGICVEREKRRVTIKSIDIIDIDMDNCSVTINVKCSKGTYIRTLCDDIGAALGCGAYMNSLKRTVSAGFDISKSHTIEELESMNSNEFLKALIPTDKLFLMYPSVRVDERQKYFIINGVRTRYKGLIEGATYRVYDSEGAFLCLSKCMEERLTLVKAFWNT